MCEKNALCALGNGLVRVGRKYGKKFSADFRRERGAARADCQLSFGPRMPGADFFAQFRANGILPRRTSNLFA